MFCRLWFKNLRIDMCVYWLAWRQGHVSLCHGSTCFRMTVRANVTYILDISFKTSKQILIKFQTKDSCRKEATVTYFRKS